MNPQKSSQKETASPADRLADDFLTWGEKEITFKMIQKRISYNTFTKLNIRIYRNIFIYTNISIIFYIYSIFIFIVIVIPINFTVIYSNLSICLVTSCSSYCTTFKFLF